MSIGVANESDVIHEINSFLKITNSTSKTKFENYYKDNFIFIDIGGDYKIIEDVNENICISDRAKLAALLKQMAEDSALIDIIVLDAYFDKSSVGDSLLLAEDDSLKKYIYEFARQGKIVVGNSKSNIFNFDSLNLYGNITHEGHNGMLVDEQLIRNDGLKSLPYLAYQKLTKSDNSHLIALNNFYLEYGQEYNFHPIYNKFIPKCFLDDNFIHYFGEIEHSNSFEANKSVKYYQMYLFQRNYPLFTELLQNHKTNGDKINEGKNIIILGTLSENANDIHRTIFGKTHGVTFIINSLIALLLGYHTHFFTGLIFMVFFCAFYCLLVFYPSCFIYMGNFLIKTVAKSIPSFTTFTTEIRKFIISNSIYIFLHKYIFPFFHLFRDELFTFAFNFILFLIYFNFHTLPNVFLALLLFYINLKTLEHHKRKIDKQISVNN